MTSIEQTIAEELEYFRKVPHELCGPPSNASELEVKRRFMNNFFMYFLSENTPGNYRGLSKRTGTWNKKNEEYLREFYRRNPERMETQLQEVSQLKRNQTGEEMSNTLLGIIEQQGIEMPEMECIKVLLVYSIMMVKIIKEYSVCIFVIFKDENKVPYLYSF